MLWRYGVMTVSAQRGQKTDYLRFVHITTRWMDNDVYQHVNNVVYYSFFDSAVNAIIEKRQALLSGGSEAPRDLLTSALLAVLSLRAL